MHNLSNTLNSDRKRKRGTESSSNVRILLIKAMRTPGFLDLAKNQINYHVSVFDIEEGRGSGGCVQEFWVRILRKRI